MGEVTTSMFDVLGDGTRADGGMIKADEGSDVKRCSGRLALAKLETVLAGQFDAPYR